MLARSLTLAAGALLLAAPVQAGGGGVVDAPRNVLITRICVTPTAGEYVQIHNADVDVVDMSNYYLTDATFAGGDQYYYHIVGGGNPGGGTFVDFHARFPAGTQLAPGERLVISLSGSTQFEAMYGMTPDLELWEDNGATDGVPNMLEAFPGSIDGQGGLTNSGEFLSLYWWDGQSDLVTDIDYAVWGDKSEGVSKSGVAKDGPDPDGIASVYADDRQVAEQDAIAPVAHANGDCWVRVSYGEGIELNAGGNGPRGHDETSENLAASWTTIDADPSVEPAEAQRITVGPSTLVVEGGDPGDLVFLLVGVHAGQILPSQCPDEQIGMGFPGLLALPLVQSGRSTTLHVNLPVGETGWFQAVNASTCRASNTLRIGD